MGKGKRKWRDENFGGREGGVNVEEQGQERIRGEVSRWERIGDNMTERRIGEKGDDRKEGGQGREREKEEIGVRKIAFWNVAGVGNKDREFWKGIAEWDVVVLLETWLEKKGWDKIKERLPREFKWKVQLAKRKNKKGRAMGGMLMGVRKGIEEIEEKGQEEIEGIITTRIRIKGEQWRILGVYINGDMEEKWTRIRDWVEERKVGMRMIMGGDFNARTGELGGWWEGKDERGKEEGRKSRDKKINREGRVLVEKLEEIGWFIYNGCGKGDREGMWTYAGARGESVLDYVIGDGEVWDRVLGMKVAEKVDSDHFPVVISVEGEGRGGERRKPKSKEMGVDRGRKRVI